MAGAVFEGGLSWRCRRGCREGVVAVAVAGKKDWGLLAVCGMVAMLKVVAYKGATESNGSWGHKWQSECSGGRQCPK